MICHGYEMGIARASAETRGWSKNSVHRSEMSVQFFFFFFKGGKKERLFARKYTAIGSFGTWITAGSYAIQCIHLCCLLIGLNTLRFATAVGHLFICQLEAVMTVNEMNAHIWKAKEILRGKKEKEGKGVYLKVCFAHRVLFPFLFHGRRRILNCKFFKRISFLLAQIKFAYSYVRYAQFALPPHVRKFANHYIARAWNTLSYYTFLSRPEEKLSKFIRLWTRRIPIARFRPGDQHRFG